MRKREAGFSMAELLIVVAIIGAMTAVALPNIMGYIRSSRIRTATTQLTSEINTARLKAIMKNTRNGVSFVTVTDSTYRYVLEDDQTPPFGSAAIPVITAAAEQLGPLRTLPQYVTFSDKCGAFGTSAGSPASDAGFRFNRLGAWCDPGSNSQTCPAFPDASPLWIKIVNNQINNGGARICLRDSITGATRTIEVSTGGRVVAK